MFAGSFWIFISRHPGTNAEIPIGKRRFAGFTDVPLGPGMTFFFLFATMHMSGMGKTHARGNPHRRHGCVGFTEMLTESNMEESDTDI